MRRNSRLLGNAVLGPLVLALLLAITPTFAQESLPGRTKPWKVQDAKLDLTIEEGRLVSRSKDGELVDSIPLSNLLDLSRTTETRRPVREWIKSINEDMEWERLGPAIEQMLAEDPRSIIGVPLIPLVANLEVALLLPFQGIKTHTHTVQVVWELDGREDIRVYKLSRKDARSLVEALRKETGKSWVEYSPYEDLKSKGGMHMTVHLPDGTAVGKTYFMNGNYRLAFIPRGENEGVVYVLSDDLGKPEGVLAAATVEVQSISPDEPAEARFGTDANGDRYLTELRVASKSIRFNAPGANRFAGQTNEK